VNELHNQSLKENVIPPRASKHDCSDGRQSDRYTIVTKEIAEFVDRDYTHEGDIRWIVENRSKFTVLQPEDLQKEATSTHNRTWERQVDEFMTRDKKVTDNHHTVYSLTMGKCTE
jgi:hypothetical protein